MKINPIFKREIMVSSRSKSLPALICTVNGILFAVTLLGAFGVMAGMSSGAERDYSAFLQIYGVVVLIEFLLLLFITPSLTAGAVSSEREKQTFELMLATRMRPSEIILGKLSSNIAFVSILAVSCIPAMSVAVMYGGVTMGEIAVMTVAFVFESFVLMSCGMFFSSFSKSTARASALTYGFVVFLCFGTAVTAALFAAIAGRNNNYSSYLLLFNPLVNIFNIAAIQIGEPRMLADILLRLKTDAPAPLIGGWSLISIAVQAAMACVLIFFSVINISPAGKRSKALDFSPGS